MNETSVFVCSGSRCVVFALSATIPRALDGRDVVGGLSPIRGAATRDIAVECGLLRAKASAWLSRPRRDGWDGWDDLHWIHSVIISLSLAATLLAILLAVSSATA